MPGEVDDLAEALRELGRYLAAEVERSGLAPAEALRSIVQHAELAVEAVIEVSGHHGSVPVRISGRVDAVHSRGTGAIDVVEYKLTDEANQELDQAQVALYRRLLRACLDVEAEPVILRFNPGLIATRLSPAAGDAIVERRILPLLGSHGPLGRAPRGGPPDRPAATSAPPARCAPSARRRTRTGSTRAICRPPAPRTRGPGPRGASPSPPRRSPTAPPPADVDGQVEAEALEKQIVAELRRLGVMVQVARRTAGPALLRIEVMIARARAWRSSTARAKDVEHHLADARRALREGGRQARLRAPRAGGRARWTSARSWPRKAALLRARPGRFVRRRGHRRRGGRRRSLRRQHLPSPRRRTDGQR